MRSRITSTTRLVLLTATLGAAVAMTAVWPVATMAVSPAGGAEPQGRGRGGRGNPNEGADFLKRPPVVRLDPAVQQELFLLPDGYTIEPVLTDPLITDPVGVTFDGNGRMYVLEMRSYMRDAEGTGSRDPISRISRHEDTNGDGTYDRHTVFVDGLVMPRVAFPLQDGVILALETDNRDLHRYADTDGDGVADIKEVFYAGFGRVTNMEWQPGGLTWALDNWLYSTYNPYRLRILPDGGLRREETVPNGGQWWSAQDNYGKVWWVDGGGETGPVNFQTPIIYGAFNVEDNFEPDFQVPWPAPGGIADMQGGMRRVRMPDGTLNHFTAASGVEIYRGHRLPEDMIGDLLFTEPVGRIVRRAKVVVTGGLTQLQNAYPQSEFVRSTDPLFRPVAIHNAPDGTLYLVDMYTGIIQDAQFVGGYLRQKIEQYGLDEQHNNGRVWRIRRDGMTPDWTRPTMYSDAAATLVGHLSHANGWWRDAAQKELVLRRDMSVVPALEALARTSDDQLGRIHALWTLEGLDSLRADLVHELIDSPDPQIRIQAVRASETLLKAGDESFVADYQRLTKDADPEVVVQAMLTLNLHGIEGAEALIQSTAASSGARGVREIGQMVLSGQGGFQGQRPSLADAGAAAVNLSIEDRRMLQRGESTYRELCFSCHGADGAGAPMPGAPDGMTQAPSLIGSARVLGHREYVIRTLLYGLTGPMAGETFGAGVMVPMGMNTDEWVAEVASYVRNAFGNLAPFITPEEVAAVRASTTRPAPYTLEELELAVPSLLSDTSAWTVTASHNQAVVENALAGSSDRWDTGEPQRPDMWFQVEFAEPLSIEEIQFDAAQAGPSFGRGRGAIPAGPPVGYTIQVSDDGTEWSDAIASGAGSQSTRATFDPVEAKFVRITQTGMPTGNQAWAIQHLRIFETGR